MATEMRTEKPSALHDDRHWSFTDQAVVERSPLAAAVAAQPQQGLTTGASVVCILYPDMNLTHLLSR
jgi:hypothetical protein